jgi:anaerobic selenocysteine-containing dehydrogenase
MRELCPDPIVEIHPDTAGALDVSDGDWVWIENHHGRCRQRAKLTPTLRPEVVHAQHSWWFPEQDMAEPVLGGAWQSNINLLLPPDLQGESGFGYPFKVNICKIYREERNGRL